MNQKLKGYIVATKAEVDQDELILGSAKVYFNLSDAKEAQKQGGQIFAVDVPFPQRGDGSYEGDEDDF